MSRACRARIATRRRRRGAQCLTDLKSRVPVNVPIYDFKTHSRSSDQQSVQPGDVIIFEGILARRRPAPAPRSHAARRICELR